MRGFEFYHLLYIVTCFMFYDFVSVDFYTTKAVDIIDSSIKKHTHIYPKSLLHNTGDQNQLLMDLH